MLLLNLCCFLLLFKIPNVLSEPSDIEHLRVLRHLDQESDDGNDIGSTDETNVHNIPPFFLKSSVTPRPKPTVDTVGSVRWVKMFSNESVTNGTRRAAEEVIKNMKMPIEDFVVYTRASIDNEISGPWFKFDNYIMDFLKSNPDLSSSYPGFAIGYIQENCAAALIGPYHALTAAECVYNITSGKWNTKLDLLRGRNCDTYLQYMVWESVTVPYQYIVHGNNEFNWAYIEYNSKFRSPVWLSITYDPKLSERYTAVTVNGYTPQGSKACLHSNICLLATNTNSKRLVQLGCDIPTSFPGAPIVANDYLISTTKSLPIYALGTMSYNNTSVSPVTRITKSMFWLLSYWMKESGYNPECQKRHRELRRIIVPLKD